MNPKTIALKEKADGMRWAVAPEGHGAADFFKSYDEAELCMMQTGRVAIEIDEYIRELEIKNPG